MSEHHESILKLLNLYVEEMGFTGTGVCNNGETTLRYSRDMLLNPDGTRSVRLSVLGKCPNGASFKIQLVGVFHIELNETVGEEILETLYKDNTVAILFPYLRSQISLLTTQPNMAPIYLPPMNMVNLFKEAEKRTVADS